MPSGLTDGECYIVNSNGSSNFLPFIIISADGYPKITTQIPNISINSGDTRIIGNLNKFFWDPNDDSLEFSVNTSNESIHIVSDSLLNGKLIIKQEGELFNETSVIVTATDPLSKSVSDTLTVFGKFPTYKISGKTYYYDSDIPIPYAKVELMANDLIFDSIITDNNGKYLISEKDNGHYLLTAMKEGNWGGG